MHRVLVFLCALIAALPLDALAQHDGAAPASAETHQFDFLLGRWEVDVEVKVSTLAALIHGTPRLAGTWKAWRALDDRGIEDELRVVDASGNPLTLNRSLRIWSPGEQRWKIAGVDAYNARTSESSGRLQDGEMRIDGHFSEAQDHATMTRTRYRDITPEHFVMQQDRSVDGGKTWDENALTIDAKRIAANATPD